MSQFFEINEKRYVMKKSMTINTPETISIVDVDRKINKNGMMQRIIQTYMLSQGLLGKS